MVHVSTTACFTIYWGGSWSFCALHIIPRSEFRKIPLPDIDLVSVLDPSRSLWSFEIDRMIWIDPRPSIHDYWSVYLFVPHGILICLKVGHTLKQFTNRCFMPVKWKQRGRQRYKLSSMLWSRASMKHSLLTKVFPLIKWSEATRVGERTNTLTRASHVSTISSLVDSAIGHITFPPIIMGQKPDLDRNSGHSVSLRYSSSASWERIS